MKAGVIRYLPLILCFACHGTVYARVLHVPAEFPTIRSAFDSTRNGDTVLVEPGVYAEALTAPSRSFVLKGNVDPDTGHADRPVIDPSTLSNPHLRGCLLLPVQSLPVIEDFVFRNGPEMYPHEVGVHGGIRSYSPNAVFRRCLWDSTYYGITGGPTSLTLYSCRMEFVQSGAVHPWDRAMQAYDCYFQSTGGSVIGAYEGSILLRCEIRGMSPIGPLLNAGGPGTLIHDCIFGSFNPSNGYPLDFYGLGGEFSNNLIVDGVRSLSGACLNAWVPCGGEPLVVRNNRFVTITQCPLLQVYCIEGTEGPNAIIEGNTFDQCGSMENQVFKGLLLEAPATILGNRFSNLFPLRVPTINVRSMDVVVHQNIFSETGEAMSATFQTDAVGNWWGDSTGPYHPSLNPTGLGDTVGNNIDFIPWLTDTLVRARDRPTTLPSQCSLTIAPNPFNSSTRVFIEVDRIGVYRLELFDLLGRKVKDLWAAPLIDRTSVSLDFSDTASGIYYARLWRNSDRLPVAHTKIAVVK